MRDERLEQAVRRIERALARIAAAADASQGERRSDGAPSGEQGDAMRQRVRAELAKLDDVIGRLEE